jgi:hypothetical protein
LIILACGAISFEQFFFFFKKIKIKGEWGGDDPQSPPTYTWKLHNLGFRISAIYWKKQFWSKLGYVVGFLCQPIYNNRH